MKRIIAILLCLSILAPWIPGRAAAAETNQIATIEEQIRAFAASIDQTDAVDTAAMAMAVHGMTKGGKKLSVGKSHTLTALLLNSEIMLTGLTEACTSAIRSMQQLDRTELDQIYGCGYWLGEGESYFYARVYNTTIAETVYLDWMLTDVWDRTGKRNSYDEALDWIVGFASLEMTFTQTKITDDSVTYKVSLTISDRFDFATSSNSLFKGLISGIGALLFREFDWESKVSFDLTVPYECAHGSGNYHWTYDPESQILTSDSAGGFRTNAVTRLNYTAADGTCTYYHELAEPVRLLHDQPWVMEFHTQNPGAFYMGPLRENSTSHPFLKIHGRSYIAIGDRERILLSDETTEEYGLASNLGSQYHYYRTTLMGRFSFTTTKRYTIRLENQVNTDGSNMICVSVRDTATGAVLLEPTPMDEYVLYQTWSGTEIPQSGGNDWVSGKDLYISYIGSKTLRFAPAYFDLYIWENGEGGEAVSYYEASSVTAPTCTEKGYTTYTCTACGHSKKADYVAANGHSYDAVVTPPTCTEDGCTTHTCTVCGDSYTDSYVKETGHAMGAWIETLAPTCTQPGVEQRVCGSCAYTENRETAALGHSYDCAVTPPSCTETGAATYICTRCAASESETIPAAGHAYTSQVTPATCTTQGYTTYTCTACGSSYEDDHTAVLEHSYVGGACTGCGDRRFADAVPQLSCSNVSASGKIRLSWNEVEGAVSYKIYRASSQNGTYSHIATTSKTRITNSSIGAGERYYYYVVAVDENGVESRKSNTAARVCDLAQPRVTLTNRASDGKIVVRWGSVKGAVKYEVYRATSSDGPYTRLTTTRSTSINNTSTKAGKTYYYKVRAVCDVDAAASAYSAVASKTCDLAQPELSIARSGGKPRLSWGKVSGAVRYEVYRATSKNGSYELVKTTTSRAWKDTTAKKNKTYYYKVIAVCSNAEGSSAFSNIRSIKATK